MLFVSSTPFDVTCDDADGPANWDSSSSSTLSNTPFSRTEDASEVPKSLLGSVARLGMGDRDRDTSSDTIVLVPAVWRVRRVIEPHDLPELRVRVDAGKMVSVRYASNKECIQLSLPAADFFFRILPLPPRPVDLHRRVRNKDARIKDQMK